MYSEILCYTEVRQQLTHPLVIRRFFHKFTVNMIRIVYGYNSPWYEQPWYK